MSQAEYAQPIVLTQEAAAVRTVPAVSNPVLADKAAAIHKLIKRARQDIVEIGRHLAEARDHVDHGEWLTWINTEFGWSDQIARRFGHVYELSQDAKFNKLLNFDLPLSVLDVRLAIRATTT